jgi:ATP-dependent DNA helicase RecG
MEILELRERVRNAILLGESHFREFKSAWERTPHDRKPRDPRAIAQDIAETLVAFANADGGELFVGVEDDGAISGVPHSNETIKLFLEAHRSRVHPETPLPSVTAVDLEGAGRVLLYFAVDKSAEFVHLTSDGRCLQRKDRETVPVTAERLHFERQEQRSREYDRQFVDGASVTDLNMDLVRVASDSAGLDMSPEKYLQFVGLAEYGMGTIRLRRAALLLFAQDVSRWHPRCAVRILRIRGTELKTGRDYNVGADDLVVANVLTLIESAWERMRPHLVETKLVGGGLFREQIMYPEDVCREALTNAIAHRDYATEGRGIEVHVFDDKMEVRSPGALLSTVTIEELVRLTGVHQSRNAHITRVLREMGYMREVGEGIRRIFDLMHSRDLVAPELSSSEGQFAIMLRHQSVFSEADERWLQGYDFLQLTRDEMIIALMGRGGKMLSPNDIFRAAAIVDTEVYRALIESMRLKGILYGQTTRVASRERRSGRRDLPRYRVRAASELEPSIAGLVGALRTAGPVKRIGPDYLSGVARKLEKSNPFRAQLRKFFGLVGLMDDRGNPTQRLQTIWRTEVG